MELENIQSLLQLAGIEVDIKTLQNPTEEFMIYLVTEYLKRFNFDGNEIAKPTPEQFDCVSSKEHALDAIKAINLHAALVTICEEIFLKDLTLTDITSPGCKKACKRIKVLFNFFVYVKNKKMEQEHLFCELENLQKEFHDMVDKKSEIIIKIGATISEREKKLEYKNKLEKEIGEIAKKIEQNDEKAKKVQIQVERVSAVHQEKLYESNVLKTKAHELYKITKDLQSKIVKSPNEYFTRKDELKRILDEKMKERESVNDSISCKKNQIQTNILAEAEVKSCLEKFNDAREIIQKLKKTNTKLQTFESQINKLKTEIDLLEHQRNRSKSEEMSFEPIDTEESQRLLQELDNSILQKQREHDQLSEKYEKLQTERAKIETALIKEKKFISITENDCSILLQNYKTQFNNLLYEEVDFRDSLNQLKSNFLYQS